MTTEKQIEKTNGTVKSVRKDKKGVQLEDGTWYSGFAILDCNKGDTVEIEYLTNGMFRNIKQIITQKAKPVNNFTATDNQKLASIYVSYAKDLCCAGKIDISQIKEFATAFSVICKEVEGELTK